MKRILGALTALLIGIGLYVGAAQAAPCAGNGWQPTFVHDLDKEVGPFYVTANGGFIKLRGTDGAIWKQHACELINQQGLRDRRGFTTCQEYTRVQCGCQKVDLSNNTCRAFKAQRP